MKYVFTLALVGFISLSFANVVSANTTLDSLYVKANTITAEKVRNGQMSQDLASRILEKIYDVLYNDPVRNDQIRKNDLATIKTAILAYEANQNMPISQSLNTLTPNFKGICKANHPNCEKFDLIDLSVLVNGSYLEKSLYDPRETLTRADTQYYISYGYWVPDANGNLANDINGKTILANEKQLVLSAVLSNDKKYYLKVR